ncbi:MAG: hypothetical protein WCS17_04340 [Prevotella sp.]
MKVLIVFIHSCRINTISMLMAVQKIVNVTVIQFMIPNNLGLV